MIELNTFFLAHCSSSMSSLTLIDADVNYRVDVRRLFYIIIAGIICVNSVREKIVFILLFFNIVFFLLILKNY